MDLIGIANKTNVDRIRLAKSHTHKRERHKDYPWHYFISLSAGWRKDGACLLEFESKNDHWMGLTLDYTAPRSNPQGHFYFQKYLIL